MLLDVSRVVIFLIIIIIIVIALILKIIYAFTMTIRETVLAACSDDDSELARSRKPNLC